MISLSFIEGDILSYCTREALHNALAKLDSRSRDIIQRRWLADDKPTLHELAREHGISAERIRQLEAKALEQMKDVLAA